MPVTNVCGDGELRDNVEGVDVDRDGIDGKEQAQESPGEARPGCA